jgi:hypothetical protein
MNVRGAHFLKGDISAFDAGFFGLNQLEVKVSTIQIGFSGGRGKLWTNSY